VSDFTVTPIAEKGIGADIDASISIETAMQWVEEGRHATPDEAMAILRAMQREIHFRWEQRTALSFRLQDLRMELVRAGVDDMSPLYEKFHSLTSTAEGWMHPGTLREAAGAHLAALKQRIVELEEKANAVKPAKLPEVVYDSIRVQRHMKSGGYNVDVSTVSKVLDAVVRIADCDAAAAGPGDQG
jgi:hypothetical protein